MESIREFLNLVICSLISADNNMSEQEIKENLKHLCSLEDKLKNSSDDTYLSDEDKQFYIERIQQGKNILYNDLKELDNNNAN